MYFPDTGYPIEWMQTIWAGIAVLMTIWAMWDCIKDAAGVPKEEAARRVLATKVVLTEVFKLMAKLAFLVIGVVSILLPPPHVDLSPESLRAMQLTELDAEYMLSLTITRLCIMWATLWLMVDSIVARIMRRKFIRRVRWTGEDFPPPPVADPRALRHYPALIPKQPRQSDLKDATFEDDPIRSTDSGHYQLDIDPPKE